MVMAWLWFLAKKLRPSWHIIMVHFLVVIKENCEQHIDICPTLEHFFRSSFTVWLPPLVRFSLGLMCPCFITYYDPFEWRFFCQSIAIWELTLVAYVSYEKHQLQLLVTNQIKYHHQQLSYGNSTIIQYYLLHLCNVLISQWPAKRGLLLVSSRPSPRSIYYL